MKCKTCGKGWPEVRVVTYLGDVAGLFGFADADNAINLCDDCLLATN